MFKKIRAGIIGGAGYTGGELLRILLNHPDVDIAFVHSNSNAGKFVFEVHTDLFGETTLSFSSEMSSNIDVLFLCGGHGEAKKFLTENTIDEHVRIIDLSQDFRLNSKFGNRKFVYGLPEVDRNKIAEAHNIANPGCFATAIQLALLPMAFEQLIESDVHISGITGSSGAGQSLSATSHFSWRNNNISTYKVFSHQHVREIEQSLRRMQPGMNNQLWFVPYRGNFTRGIWATCYVKSSMDIEEAEVLYRNYYEHHPFIHIVSENPHLKQVVNTNKCLIYLEKHDGMLVIVSIIDNLLKGASGQAVQNMNLMFGIEETAGLKLKAMAF
jgi:N-acetyl-gamma-glutamyl-phosphate reductase